MLAAAFNMARILVVEEDLRCHDDNYGGGCQLRRDEMAWQRGGGERMQRVKDERSGRILGLRFRIAV